jgi:hypothetical protein
MSKPTFKALVLLLALIAVYYWKILFTDQFSLLTVSEGASQAYAWLHFWVASVLQGTLPLWDPYTFSGRPFPGEMQTQAFYPLHLIFLLTPGRAALAQALEYWFVFVHFLGACFMFALARELGLGRFAATIAGLAFALGNFLAISSWPHFWESAVWLPLVLLFVVRAVRAADRRGLVGNATAAGLALGLSILAGGLHFAMMAAVVAVTAGAYAGFERSGKGRWSVPALAVGIAAVVSFCVGAAQLFASVEYSQVALRWITGGPAQPAGQRIPYAYLGDHMWPQGFLGMLIPGAYGGKLGPGEAGVLSYYIGVLPLLAAAIGIWKCWGRPWVRYLAGLAAVAFFYSLGQLSLLHGVLYALVPGLSLAREADRFLFLASFALAALAGFGVEALLTETEHGWHGPRRILKWGMAACAAALAVPAVFARVTLDPMVAFSVVMILTSCALLLYIMRGHTGSVARVLMAALVLFDLSAFFPSAVDKIEAEQKGTNELEKLWSLRGAAAFLKSQPGLFRVEVEAEPRLNIGDLYEVPWVMGTGVTIVKDYYSLLGRADLLNARYVVRPASATEPGPVYQDAVWKVYERPGAYPRAWIVHETQVETPGAGLQGVDLRRVAVLGAPLAAELEPAEQGTESVTFRRYEAQRLELDVHAAGRGMVVLSEVFYPGWRAEVNGKPARIYEADGGLRGVVVPGGESHVVLEYAPWLVWIGVGLTALGLVGGLAVVWRGVRLRD